MVRSIFVTTVLLAFSLTGCGADDDRSAPEDTGGSGSGGGTGGGAPACDDAFAKVPSPYTPNTSLADWGGFAVDERGAVFAAIPDSSLTDDTSPYDPVIMASDLAGNLTTLHTGSALFGNMILRGDSVYMLAGPVLPTIQKMARGGGEPVEIVDATVVAGPILRGELIYYAKGGFSDAGIYRLDPDTDASTLLVAREDEIATVDVDGDTLYWVESDGLLADTDYRLFSMPAAGGSATMVQALPRAALALGSFRVIDSTLFGSEITKDFDIVVTRTPIGEAPVVVEDSGGLPLVIGDAVAYYGSLSGGIIKAPLSFANKTPVPGTAGRAIYSLAIGPDDLWYSELSCIYRTAK